MIQGAEAIIKSKGSHIIKIRPKKEYRLEVIDAQFRKLRTRSEAKMLDRVSKLGFAPNVIEVDEKEATIIMEKVPGKKVRDVLTASSYKKIANEIGCAIAQLHNNNIIHADLTTSNMILAKKLFLIDFGLSYISHRSEDMAVDLHLLHQALTSYHSTFAAKAFEEIIKSYQKEKTNAAIVLQRFEIVTKRGRNKH